MANVVNKNKFNPVNAEYLTQALSVKAAKGDFELEVMGFTDNH